MPEVTFEVGDVVVLKSGGPYMTISNLDEATQVLECIWFDEDELKHLDHFPQEVLEAVSFQDDFEDVEEEESVEEEDADDEDEMMDEPKEEVTEDEESENDESGKATITAKRKKK